MRRWQGEDSVVLEFGTGLGGMLLALARDSRCGLGVDTNRGYLRQARRLAASVGASRVSFEAYDGGRVPFPAPPVDLLFATGAFERISPSETIRYLTEFRGHISDRGVAVIGLLAERARGCRMTRLLGDSAYTFWTESDARAAFSRAGWRPIGREEFGPNEDATTGAPLLVADRWVLQPDGGAVRQAAPVGRNGSGGPAAPPSSVKPAGDASTLSG